MFIVAFAWSLALAALHAEPTVPPVRARGNLAPYFVPEAYPEQAHLAREEGTVRFAFEVGPDGRVTGCSILASSGSRALDEGTCRIMRNQARLTPARDAEGRATSDRLTASIGWQLPDVLPAEPLAASLADYVSASDYPAESLQSGEQGLVDFTLLISDEGRPTDCTITHSSGSPRLDQATCRAMRERARFAPARNARRRNIASGGHGSLLWRIENGAGTVTAAPKVALHARARANLASYVSDDDYPAIALRHGDGGRVVFVLHVSASGDVTECSVVASTATPLLDARTCEIMRMRAHFEPATDEAGNAAPDLVSGSLTWLP